MKVCLEPGCPALTERTRCVEHERAKDRARGTAAARGYGADHRNERERSAPLVATGNVKCWRCGEYIPAGLFDLGHDEREHEEAGR